MKEGNVDNDAAIDSTLLSFGHQLGRIALSSSPQLKARYRSYAFGRVRLRRVTRDGPGIV
jgi:hypothetical protein